VAKAELLREKFNEDEQRPSPFPMKLKIFSLYGGLAVFFVALTVFVSGCAQPTKAPIQAPAMQRITRWSYPEFEDDLSYDGLQYGIKQSLAYLQQIPPDRPFVFGNDRFDTAHMIRSLQHFLAYLQRKPSRRELAGFIQTNYQVYQTSGRDGRGEVLFTGYYEPHLQGSLVQTEKYPFPIYGRPNDLITIDLSLFSEKYAGEKIIGRLTPDSVVPYYDRGEIESRNLLAGRSEVLAWVDDPVDIFFLQIQGSGKVYLNTGEVLNVHYHTTNGRPYRSIGKLLMDEKKISLEEMSMQKIRQYLQDHPEEMQSVFNYNPSYVFFKIEPEGPLGSINVKLTPGRSIALDRRLFPPAALTYVETEKPVIDSRGQIQRWMRCSRFMLNQDTGGAINGPGRADLFWGDGSYAEIAAGHLKNLGRLYLLVLKPDARGALAREGDQ
jgi:membrane-bound lytic murein transglycosylase A